MARKKELSQKKSKDWRFLGESEREFMQQRESLQEARTQRVAFEKEQQAAKQETAFGRIKGALRGLDTSNRTKPARFKPVQRIDFTAEQRFLQSTFASDEPLMFGTGRNLPQNNEILRSGGGLIKNGDFNKDTARMFGF